MTRAPDIISIGETMDTVEKSVNWLSPDMQAFADYLSWRRVRMAVETATQNDHDAQMKLVGKMGIVQELIALIDNNREAAKRKTPDAE